MSPVGTPDFDANLNDDKSVQVIDPGEVANRINRGMGSMIRSGSWLWGDDFANYTAGQYGSSGGTLAADLTQVCRPGAKQSLRLTTGAVATNLADINRDTPVYPTRMGLECFMAFPVLSANGFTVLLRNVWNRSSDLAPYGHNASVQIVMAASAYSLQVLVDNSPGTGVFQTILNPLRIKGVTAAQFHFVKLIADFQTGMYSTLYIDYMKIDLSSYAMGRPTAAAANSGLWMSSVARITTDSAGAKVMNIGDLIFTKDEP